MIPKISILVAARKDSKYLSKLLFSLFETSYLEPECLVMLNKNDTWNKELVDYFSDNEDVTFYYEDKKLGRAGLHIYFNELVQHATGDWILYVCDDHYFILEGWDKIVAQKINKLKLNPKEPWCLIPKFDNVGAMNQILSKGYIKALGGILGRHGNIDSYINDVNRAMGTKLDRERVVRFDEEMFHDFTHDKPGPFAEFDTNIGQHIDIRIVVPKYSDPITQKFIAEDAEKLKEAIEHEL